MLNGIYNIKDKLTIHILVVNYTNKYVTFNEEQCIGNIELSSDHMPQTAINGVTTQRMLDEHIQPDILKPPWHILPDDVRISLN